MRMAVWKVPKPWVQSKFDNTETKRIVFKGLEDGKSYYLNLNTKFPNQVKSWEPHLKTGNVLDVTLQSNGKNINYFIPFYVVKDITKA